MVLRLLLTYPSTQLSIEIIAFIVHPRRDHLCDSMAASWYTACYQNCQICGCSLQIRSPRNVPFYNIEIVVAPAGSFPLLTPTKVFAYIWAFMWERVNREEGWPEATNCQLFVSTSKLQIGKMDLNLLPVPTLSANLTSTGSNKSAIGYAGDLTGNVSRSIIPTTFGSGTLGEDDISITQEYTGAKSINKTILYLFANVLGNLWQQKPQTKATDLFSHV